MNRLVLVPGLPLHEANAFVTHNHDHHRPARGCLFNLGVRVDGEIPLRGVAILSNSTRDEWPSSHPCPRRLEHVRGLVRGYTREGDRLLDPFAGSCTLLAVALQTGREADGFEIDAGFCAEAAAKLGDLSGVAVPTVAGPLFAAWGGR